MPEYQMTRTEAQRQATIIRNYWADRGFRVNVEVDSEVHDDGKTVWLVRSNLVNGLPKNAVIRPVTDSRLAHRR